MLNCDHGFYLIKSLQALMMILPQEQSYFSLCNRIKCLNVVSFSNDKLSMSTKHKINEKDKEIIGKCMEMFQHALEILNKIDKFE